MWPFVEGEAGMKNGFVQFCQRLQTCTTTKAYHPKKLKPRFHRQPSPSRNPAECYSFGDATISFPSKPDDWHLGSLFPNPCVCLRFLRDDGHWHTARMQSDLFACMRVDGGKTQSKDLAMTFEILHVDGGRAQSHDLAMT